MAEDSEKLKDFLKKYSLDDLAKSFFVINLWLPNIASPIKIQYLYVCLEAIHDQLQGANKINNYNDFREFYEKLIPLVPGFMMLEDYIPEADWGDVKYYFNKKFYRIFYGGDLSNPYDFYYSYELIHTPLEDKYLELLKRSPLTELEFCLGLQDDLFKNLNQGESPTQETVTPGHIELPDEKFWEEGIRFIDSFDIDEYSPDILGIFTKELDKTEILPASGAFEENAYKGRNCRYFFIKKGDKVYPVMPRRWFSVLYDKWGLLLKDNYPAIKEKLGDKDPNILMGIELGHFIKQRISEGHLFGLTAPVGEDHRPPNELVYTAIHAHDKLYLIYTTPPVLDHQKLSDHLEEIAPKLKQSADLVAKQPTRLGLFAEKQIVEFRSEKQSSLEPVFILALPSPLTEVDGMVRVPEGIEAEIMTLDQVAGIFDEIESLKELNGFIENIQEERKLSRIPPLNSYLDRFGSYKDSYGVLVPGAREPNQIVLDFGWGSNYRFKSLKDFWGSYPEENLFGHPRGWKIPESRVTETGLVLDSKSFFGYAFVQKVGNAPFFINAPVHRMDIEVGGFTDNLMNSLFDAIGLYIETIEGLEITKNHNKVQFFFCPSTLAETDPDLSHVRHLVPKKELWLIDSSRIRSADFGVRVVYNMDRVRDSLKDAKDRSIQISLLVDVLEKLNEVYPDPNVGKVISFLEGEKDKKPRFGSFAVEKRASFPQFVRTNKPKEKDFKMADKKIAEIALALDIHPGDYTADEAREKLNLLRSKVVELLDTEIKKYDFQTSLTLLFERSNALINDAWRTEAELKATRGHDVDYDAAERSSEQEKEYIHWYRVFRYLIEKFVQHRPSGEELTDEKLEEILGLTDRLMDLYISSDFINYEMYPVTVTIDHDYIVSIHHKEHNISTMEKEYGEEQARINLGIIGKKDDTADASLTVEEYLDELDEAFRKDLGFGLRNLINVQQVLALWAEIAKVTEATHYSAKLDKINEVCVGEIKGYDESETKNILDFLTLDSEKLLVIKNDDRIPEDLPIWEHNKRLTRFDIRPLVKIKDEYYWAPHSVERTSRIWMGISGKHKLPSDIDASTVVSVLDKGHKSLEKNIEEKTLEIIQRHTTYAQPTVSPNKYDKSSGDVGDFDVLAYLEDKNIILNIETKIIDPPHSLKDSGQVQRKIFFGHVSTKTGKYKKCYIEKVQDREAYLKSKGVELLKNLKWPIKDNPKVVSVFVTKIGFWWTKHPPVETGINFVEIRMLDDFIKGIIE